jgi:ABC-type dipeptide/oligopeptide/nickel transport system permease subunit
MLSDGFARIFQSAWPVVWPALALTITALGLTRLGEALREHFARQGG